MIKKALACLITSSLLVSLNPSLLLAADIYVAKSGDNENSGAKGAPLATISAGIKKSAAGDVVHVATGVYSEKLNLNKSGSLTSGYLTLKNEEGASPIIDGHGVIINASYVKLIGFEIKNVTHGETPTGVEVKGSSHHVEIRNNQIHDIKSNKNAHGLSVYGEEGVSINNLIIDGNEIYDCELGQSEAMVLNGNVENWVVSNNYVHDNNNIGIDFIGYERTGPKGKDQARNGHCFGNLVKNNSSAKNPTYGGEKSAGGIYVDGGKDIVIEKNTIDHCDIGIEVASEHRGKATSNITVRSNFISRGFQANILVGGYAAKRGDAQNIFIINNTLYQGGDAEIALQHNCNRVNIKNNIMIAKSNNEYVSKWGKNNSHITLDTNLYFGSSHHETGSWDDNAAIFKNPMIVRGPHDLHLKKGSPAINRGLELSVEELGTKDADGGARIRGGNVDMGAHEFNPSPTDPPNTSTNK